MKNQKMRFTAWLLTLAMIFAMIPVVALPAVAADGDACASTTDCTGTYANGFCTVCAGYEPAIRVTAQNYESLGLASDYVGYYAIGNAGQLYWFSWLENTKGSGREDINSEGWYLVMDNAVLIADITVNENLLATVYAQGFDPATTTLREWKPIAPFTQGVYDVYLGTFDGNGHTISGLYFNDSNTNYVGLVGSLANSADAHGTVKNLGLPDSYFEGGNFVGSVAGNSVGEVKNCYHEGVVIGNQDVGGIVGTNDGTVQACYNVGTVDGEGDFGDVIGYTTDRSTVDNCYYLSDIDSDGIDGTTAKNARQFASGEVAYLLGDAFGQTIDENGDEYPVFATASNKVYRNILSGCTESTVTYEYSNTEKEPNYTHAAFDESSFCTDCGKGYEPATDSDGDGYYDLDNAGNLYWFAAQVNGGNTAINGELTANIAVNADLMDKITIGEDGVATVKDSEPLRTWTPIGSEPNPYIGTFNGAGFTVSGLYFNDSAADYVGLFGYVGEGGTVRNLSVVDSYICGNDYVSGVVGFNKGTVMNCSNSGTVSGTSDDVGGVVGRNYHGTVKSCNNTRTVIGTHYGVGGVVGDNTSGTVESCSNTGSVSGTDFDVGGVVGFSNGTVTSCSNSGTVSGTKYTGGVVGNNCDGTIKNSYNTAIVSGTACVGGVIGVSQGKAIVENCYNTGTVSGTGNYVGGVVGQLHDGTIENCYYLSGYAVDGNSTVQLGIGNETAGSTTADVDGQTIGKFTAQFASGEVAYLLGSAWGQNIGTENTPVLGGKKVYYGYVSCAGDAAKVYTNTTASAEKPGHTLTYTVSGTTITATCTAESCGYSGSVTIKAEGKTYDGTPVTATLDGSIDGVATPEITYSGNTNAGTYTASITLGGATASVDFTIAKVMPFYTAPTGLTATYGDTLADVALPEGFSWKDADAAVGNAGRNLHVAIFTPEDTDNYNTVEVEVTVAVQPMTVTEATVTLSQTEYEYDGTAKKPVVTSVVVDGKTLTEGVDYEIVGYVNNVNAGDAAVTVKGIGNCSGTASKTFTIAPRVAELVWDNTTLEFNGERQVPTVSVSNLLEGDECQVTVKGTGKYAGTFTAAAVALDNPNYVLPENATVEYTIWADSYKVMSDIVPESVKTAVSEAVSTAVEDAMAEIGTALRNTVEDALENAFNGLMEDLKGRLSKMFG